MFVKNVVLYIQADHIADFIEATKENQRNSRLEPGITCFDFFQHQDDKTRFLLHEIYSSEQAVIDHTQSEHYKKWVELVRPWFLQPVDRSLYLTID
jgi:autoinducer 2-degrading protein